MKLYNNYNIQYIQMTQREIAKTIIRNSFGMFSGREYGRISPVEIQEQLPTDADIFTKLGIIELGRANKHFSYVLLPVSWKLVEVNSNYQQLLDDTGKERASIFISVTSHDFRASIYLT